MKALLEYFFNDFDVLYLDPQYRITNPSSRGYPMSVAMKKYPLVAK